MVDGSRSTRSAALVLGAVFLALLPAAAAAHASDLGGKSSGSMRVRRCKEAPAGRHLSPTSPSLLPPSPLASEPLAASVLQQVELSDPGAVAYDSSAPRSHFPVTQLWSALREHEQPNRPRCRVHLRVVGTGWTQQAKLSDPNALAGDAFGASVALLGDTALVGASGTTVGGRSDAGAAYVFTRSGGTWSLRAELTASDAAAGDYFGDSVALSADRLWWAPAPRRSTIKAPPTPPTCLLAPVPAGRSKPS